MRSRGNSTGSKGFYYIKRQRNLSGAKLVRALTLGFLSKSAATLEELTPSGVLTEVAISPQGLAKRFPAEAATFLQPVLEEAVNTHLASLPNQESSMNLNLGEHSTMLPTSPQLRAATLSRPQLVVPAPLRVSEAEYWENYYEESDHHYEWNNGYLEEKGVSDYATILMYDWFVKLLDQYLTAQPMAQKTFLEMGFRLVLPNRNKVTIRKPDLGVVRYDNPVSIGQFDNSYRGTYDLCVEALSHSTTAELRRDTVTKKEEYAAAGVKEYYILYAKGEPMAFYRLNARGVYVPIKPVAGDLIKSKVLPGFQFRRADLSRQPSLEEMSEDAVYQTFVGLSLQAAKRAATVAQQQAVAAQQQVAVVQQQAMAAQQQVAVVQQQALAAQQQAATEANRADQAEARIQQLEQELARLHLKP